MEIRKEKNSFEKSEDSVIQLNVFNPNLILRFSEYCLTFNYWQNCKHIKKASCKIPVSDSQWSFSDLKQKDAIFQVSRIVYNVFFSGHMQLAWLPKQTKAQSKKHRLCR